ncbi:hypothetical protein FRC06_008246 [Ceratobasidium sp. 370]|nr:hypothetical protein FRC06_008246 [Ceratobasidium sp. 370]
MPGLQWPQDATTSPKSHRSDLTVSDKPSPVRPGGSLKRNPSANTRYMNMLLELDAVPKIHNMLASFFTLILLAGFIIFPGTFTSIQGLDVDDPSRSGAEKWILGRVKNVPLLVIAGTCCVIGAAGIPGALHGLAGEFSTIVNVFSQQGGKFSATALVTAIVTGACAVVCGVLLLFYSNWKLERVKRAHHRTLRTEDLWVGPVKRAKRRGMEFEPEPGTTV